MTFQPLDTGCLTPSGLFISLRAHRQFIFSYTLLLRLYGYSLGLALNSLRNVCMLLFRQPDKGETDV